MIPLRFFVFIWAAFAAVSAVPTLRAPSTNDIMKYGWPGRENIKEKEGSVISYDRRQRNANWVCERLDKTTLAQKLADPSKCSATEDQTIPAFFRVTLKDYSGSGYDRGHLAPVEDHLETQTAACDTFIMSNLSPQVTNFNDGKWFELEERVRALTNQWDYVYVCTGPLYQTNKHEGGKNYVNYEVVGQIGLAVPSFFFKAVLLANVKTSKFETQAYILPNQDIPKADPLDKFKVDLVE
eukprot:Ihof_evm1s1163 gene=Ihof_evmTU1s1163